MLVLQAHMTTLCREIYRPEEQNPTIYCSTVNSVVRQRTFSFEPQIVKL
jgi:hypothetical protein